MTTREEVAVEPVAHHLVVKDHEGYPVVEVSMGTGVLAAVVTPLAAAAGAVAALTADWSVEVD
jgi:ApbE superfamily uncharacterized protein (UPF0280 family)